MQLIHQIQLELMHKLRLMFLNLLLDLRYIFLLFPPLITLSNILSICCLHLQNEGNQVEANVNTSSTSPPLHIPTVRPALVRPASVRPAFEHPAVRPPPVRPPSGRPPPVRPPPLTPALVRPLPAMAVYKARPFHPPASVLNPPPVRPVRPKSPPPNQPGTVDANTYAAANKGVQQRFMQFMPTPGVTKDAGPSK